MHRMDPGMVRRPEGDITLVSLGSRTQLPPRTRSLLEGILGLTGGLLERTISLALTEYEQQLFKLAEKSRNSNDQQNVFESLREVKRGRADVAPRFMIYLESSLARLDEGHKPEVPATPRRFQDLALVETRDLEENIALQEIATKAEIRLSQPLYALCHRFGVLAGSPAFDSERLPVGPHQLCQAVRHGTSCLGISMDHRLLMYRQFDRALMTELGVLYSSINEYLVEKRILRFLQDMAPRLRSHDTNQSAAPTAPGENAAPPQAASESAATVSRAASAPMRGDPGFSSPFGATMPERGARSEAPARQSDAGSTPQSPVEDVRDAELFHTLRDLLGGRRRALGSPPPPAPGRVSSYTASNDDLQAVLGSLQNKPAAPMMLGGRLVQRNIAHLKQDLLGQLRQFTPDSRPPQLAEEDSDTVDLVGMLFDFIAKDTRPDGATQNLLTKLQVPVLRVALRDKSFFTRRSHPARQLLNAIAETGQYWIDDSEGDNDRVLVEKMQLLVDRVTGEFDGKVELFDEMLGDLSRHMGTLARKAEVAERRHVDAAKGRERLDVAREQALKAISQRLQNRKPGRLVRTLLEQAWVDVLALTLLRQGEDSEIYRRRLAVADQLIENAAGDALNSVRGEIEQGLSQVGFHAEEVQSMVQQLVAPDESAQQENPSSRTELAMKLKNKTRLGEDTPGTANTETAARASARLRTLSPPMNAEERQTLERLKTLPFGTWMEFVTNQQGDMVRRKLSWFSTLTGRCLFVNQRGARADERSMEQLARDLVRGQARIVNEQKESLIDRAWHAIVGALKQFSGQAAIPLPAT
ncbi:MAG: DUF1631 domain-containing protein [Tahibacter sp.]